MATGRTVFLVLAADPERLVRVGLWALTAASVGESVDVLLTAGPLAAWLADPPGERGPLPSWREMITEARGLARVRVVTCETELSLAGVPLERVKGSVDAIESLPSFWRTLEDARVVSI